MRTLADTLEHLDDYEIAVLREWEARNASVDVATAASTLTPSEIAYPWENAPKRPDKDELKKRDQWNSLFMPPTGAFLAARADEHRKRKAEAAGQDAEPYWVPLLTESACRLEQSLGLPDEDEDTASDLDAVMASWGDE